MTSCDSRASIERIVESLYADLNEDELRREIDNRLDAAVSSLVCHAGPVRSQRVFLDAIAAFVSHVYKNGLRVPQELSPTQARAEAIALLERDYRGTHDAGYEAALLDAIGTDDRGLGFVLAHLAEVIKFRERQKYKRWVFSDHLARCGWETKCAIAEYLIERCSPMLTPQLRRSHPAQLADEIPVLVTDDLDTSNRLENVRCAVGPARCF